MSTPEEKEAIRLEKIYNIFIAWYAMPTTDRDPNIVSIDEFCERYKISKQNLVEWQNKADFTEDLYVASMAWGKSKLPDMLKILHAKFMETKNPNDFKMFKELLNMDAGTKKENEIESSGRGILRELYGKSNGHE